MIHIYEIEDPSGTFSCPKCGSNNTRKYGQTGGDNPIFAFYCKDCEYDWEKCDKKLRLYEDSFSDFYQFVLDSDEFFKIAVKLYHNEYKEHCKNSQNKTTFYDFIYNMETIGEYQFEEILKEYAKSYGWENCKIQVEFKCKVDRYFLYIYKPI